VEEPILRVENISVFYGNLEVLRHMSLEVMPREIVALIGSNSAGKTTLLDTISGLNHPKKGRLKFEQMDITYMSPFKIVSLGITQVPEGRQLFPDLTVLDNLIVGSYNPNARPGRDRNLKVVFEHFPVLEERRNQLAKTLSGGEQQMLAIGRGLMSDPKLMLLDEMSLGLAPIILEALYRALKEIKLRGITILFVEQNVRRSLEEAERAYIIEGGRIALGGTASELREEEKIKKAYFGL
jgi:branched-chain amino acid transport system ATP-binding protein